MRVAHGLLISGLAAACSPAPGAQGPPEPTPTAPAPVAAESSAATDPSASATSTAGSTPTASSAGSATAATPPSAPACKSARDCDEGLHCVVAALGELGCQGGPRCCGVAECYEGCVDGGDCPSCRPHCVHSGDLHSCRAKPVAATIDEARAIQIGLHHGMWVDQLSFPIGMRPTVTDRGTSYDIEWRPESGQGGFVYRVRIDKRTGDVLSSKASEP